MNIYQGDDLVTVTMTRDQAARLTTVLGEIIDRSQSQWSDRLYNILQGNGLSDEVGSLFVKQDGDNPAYIVVE